VTTRFPGRQGGAPPPIHLGVRQTHKGGEQPRDCQDAWWAGTNPPRVAVADGATRAFFPREWAWLVAEHFCHEGGEGLAADLLRAEERDGWRASLAPVRGEWRDAVQEAIQRSRTPGLLENRMLRKDFAVATLVGVELAHQAGGWRAVIIGDSCLMRFSAAGRFLGSEPFDHPSQFDNHPEALISVANSSRETVPRVTSGTEEVLVLATDAAAKWLLSIRESSRYDAVRYLLGNDEEGFDARVGAARRGECQGAPAMEDDDVTLMVVSFGRPLAGTRPLWEVADALPPPLSPRRLDLEQPAAEPGAAETPSAPPAAPMSEMFSSPPAVPPEVQALPDPPADVSAPVPDETAELFRPPLQAEPSGGTTAGADAGATAPAALPDDFLSAVPASVPGGEPGDVREAEAEAERTVEVAAAAASAPEEAAVREGAEPDEPVAGPPEPLPHDDGTPAAAPGEDTAASAPVGDGGAPPVPGDYGNEAPAGEAGEWVIRDEDTRGEPRVRRRRMRQMRAKVSGLIDRVARVEKRRLAVLTLAGWLLSLVMAAGVAASLLWQRRPADTGSELQTAASDTTHADSAGRSATKPEPVRETLPAGKEIFVSPRDGSPLRITLRAPVLATLRPAPVPGWRAVEIDGWVAQSAGNEVLADLRGSIVRIEGTVRVRSDSTQAATVLGIVQEQDSFPFLGRDGDGGTRGPLPIRIFGFVREAQ
jgi:hypothetical protein